MIGPHAATRMRRLIGIGGGLKTSPLPYYRTFGSRIRRFGRFSMLTHAQTLVGGFPRQPVARSGILPCKRSVVSLDDRSVLLRRRRYYTVC
jgi:hypothetical protein